MVCAESSAGKEHIGKESTAIIVMTSKQGHLPAKDVMGKDIAANAFLDMVWTRETMNASNAIEHHTEQMG